MYPGDWPSTGVSLVSLRLGDRAARPVVAGRADSTSCIIDGGIRLLGSRGSVAGRADQAAIIHTDTGLIHRTAIFSAIPGVANYARAEICNLRFPFPDKAGNSSESPKND